ncbi:cytokine receptor-like isoform X2 [Armigeres subalbatus]
MLDLRGNPYATKIINDTTIIHRVDLQTNEESSICGVKNFICRLNRSLIQMRTFYVGRPPPPIKPSDFKCISHNRQRLVCQFRRQHSCGLFTDYHLSMIRLNSHSTCNLTDDGTTLSFDSNSDTCVFSAGHRNLSFWIVATNIIGKTESMQTVDHFDIVQPEMPGNLHVSSLDVTNVNITWSLSLLLYNLNRSFEIEFRLMSKYDTQQSFKNISSFTSKQMMHQFENLFPFTNYELKMRVRVVPKSLRYFEDEYWSEWSSIQFQTKACRPYAPPRILPGAYSFKERRGHLVTIEVYWELVPEYRQNGPGFGYDIYALSQTGHNLTANSPNNGVTSFQKARIDEIYSVYFFSYNDEGRSENVSIMQIYPHIAAYQPKIRRMLYNDSYYVQWFSPDNIDLLSNYTIMYCTYSTTGSCHGSIQFDTVPANATTYFLNSSKPLSFALAANFRSYSSELSWPMCTVSPATVVNQITFKFTDVTEHSFTLRMQLSCMDQSLIDRYDVRYWPTQNHDATVNRTYQAYDTIIPIDDLLINTDYEVVITAYDSRGNTFEASNSVRTKNKEVLVQLILFLLFGMLVMAIMTTTATRRMKRIMSIKVEIPVGLLGIDETPFQNNPPVEEFKPFSEQISDTVEMEELRPSDPLDDNSSGKVKSILKKYDPTNVQAKSAAQFSTSNDYIKPSEMPCMKNLEKSIPSLGGNSYSSGSTGYVDVSLIMKQHLFGDVSL